jgi:hypothetical protein
MGSGFHPPVPFLKPLRLARIFVDGPARAIHRFDPTPAAGGGFLLFLRVFLLLFAVQGAARAGENAQVALGRKLLAENGCNGACHRKHSPNGDALSLYTRPDRKVRSFSQLQSQVASCVANTRAAIRPDEIGAVVAALNKDFYKFH